MIYKKNDFLRILFCIVTVVIVTAFFYIGSAENNAPDSSYAISSDAFTISSSSFSGSGSEEDPYLISASSQLVELSALVNGLKCRDDGRPYSACSYKLSADIDMSGISFSPIGNYTDITFYLKLSQQLIDSYQFIISEPTYWAQFKVYIYEKNGTEYTLTESSEPVDGTDYYFRFDIKNSFCGTFDGNGKTISNLSADSIYSGLFGSVQNASISKLILNNASLSGSKICGGISAVFINSEIIGCKVTNSEIVSDSDNSICGGISGTAIQKEDKDITIYEADGVTIYHEIELDDLIVDYINTARIGTISKCLNNGSTVTAGLYSGGIIGQTSKDAKLVCLLLLELKGESLTSL